MANKDYQALLDAAKKNNKEKGIGTFGGTNQPTQKTTSNPYDTYGDNAGLVEPPRQTTTDNAFNETGENAGQTQDMAGHAVSVNYSSGSGSGSGNGSGSGSGSGFGSGSGGSGSGSGSSGSSQIQPKNDDSKYLQEIEDLKGTIDALKELYATGQSDWQKQLADMANQYTTAQNDWAKQLADLYKSQDEKEAQWKLDIENMYQKGKDDAYTVAEEERKKALAAGVKQAENTISGQKENVSGSYADTLRQIYLQKMQAQKNIGQQLASQGATGGLAESTIQGLENNYQNALLQAENERTRTLNDLDRQLTDAQLAATIEEANGAADSAIGRANAYVQTLQSLLSGEQANRGQFASVLESLMNNEETRNARAAEMLQYIDSAQRSDRENNRQYAYNLASSMASSGVMPTVQLLTEAGISEADAQAIVANVNAQMAAKKAQTGTQKVQKPSETSYQIALAAYQRGDRSPEVVDTIEAYTGFGVDTVASAYELGAQPETNPETQPGTKEQPSYGSAMTTVDPKSIIASNAQYIFNTQGKDAAVSYIKDAYTGTDENNHTQLIDQQTYKALTQKYKNM